MLPEDDNPVPAAVTGLAAASGARLRSVDTLRAIAALMVVVSHLPLRQTGEALPIRLLKPMQAVGHTGVGLFLVISGFSIHLRWARTPEDRRRLSARRFWKRRFVRLYPTYYVAALLTILVLILADGFSATFSTRVPWVVAPGYVPGVAQVLGQVLIIGANVVPLAFVGVAWSLALEEQIYAGYVILIKTVKDLRPLKVLWIALGVSMVWRVGAELVTRSVPVGQFFDGGKSTQLSRVLYALPPARAFEWLLGLVAAEAFTGRLTLPPITRRIGVAVLTLGCASALFWVPVGGASLNGNRFFLSDVLLDALFGCGYFVCLNWFINTEMGPDRWKARAVSALSGLGLASYSIYLLHPIIVQVIGPHVPTSGMSRVVGMSGLCLTVVVFSGLFYWVIEKRFMLRAARIRPTI